MLKESQLKFMCYCQFSMMLVVGQICVNQAKNIYMLRQASCDLLRYTFSKLLAFPSVNITKLQKLKYPR